MRESIPKTGLFCISFLLLISNTAWAQCSGGRSGGSGRTGFNMPTSAAASYNVNPNTASSNAQYQVAMNSQRQQLDLMYRTMFYQQNQLAAMQQQLVMDRAAQARAKGQEMVAARKERAKEKENRRAETLVSSKGNKST